MCLSQTENNGNQKPKPITSFAKAAAVRKEPTAIMKEQAKKMDSEGLTKNELTQEEIDD